MKCYLRFMKGNRDLSQYADDLLVSAASEDLCEQASLCLLRHLAKKGFKAAELFALTRTCVLSEGKDVTIYTDSRNAFGIAHDFGRIWQFRGFRSAEGKPISHSSLVQDLITACHLPRSLAIVKTKAHSHDNNTEAKGNSLADRVAKSAAQAQKHSHFALPMSSLGDIYQFLFPSITVYRDPGTAPQTFWCRLFGHTQHCTACEKKLQGTEKQPLIRKKDHSQ
ncbi:hypothetical protein C0J45_2761 [Silurus meridionalis]|uniref:RNase H type-1 domain-containing protein n=1 Tax=Silurus meridionalis TaxID=175797 RepID=A0A8T0BVE1_SILME|nr:hypothetical protein HF521_016337 [Silurus meridionalis]KAI5107123.1 hypothetical protein C0J45_2761 [Silurus meridionalis]